MGVGITESVNDLESIVMVIDERAAGPGGAAELGWPTGGPAARSKSIGAEDEPVGGAGGLVMVCRDLPTPREARR